MMVRSRCRESYALAIHASKLKATEGPFAAAVDGNQLLRCRYPHATCDKIMVDLGSVGSRRGYGDRRADHIGRVWDFATATAKGRPPAARACP
jgi:hypothetical protein